MVKQFKGEHAPIRGHERGNMIRNIKTQEKKYSLIDNLIYAYKILFQMKPALKIAVPMISIVFLLGKVVETVTMPIAVGTITEGGSGLQFVLYMLGLLAVYILLKFVSNYLREWCFYYYEVAQNREFMMALVRKSLDADYVNVESPAQQRLLNRASHAVNMYRAGVSQFFINGPLILATVVGVILYSLTISFIDWRILLFVIVSTAVSTALDTYARKYTAHRLDEQYRIWGRFYYLKAQATSVENGKDIRIYNMADWIKSGFTRLIDKNAKHNYNVGIRKYAGSASELIFIAIRDIISYGIMTAMVIDGKMTIAEFTLGLSVVNGLSGMFGEIRYYLDHMRGGNMMMCEYRKMMDYPNRFKREDGIPVPEEWFEGSFPDIEFRNVSFRYEENGEDVLKNINVTIHAGERIALVGHNGAGKTTLVKLLCGFYHPTEGEILIGGIPLNALNLEEYYKLLSTIFQDVVTLPVSIASNISATFAEETDMERVRECLRRAGLDGVVNELPNKEMTELTQTFSADGVLLSGGQMQKLMLARCIYKDAPLLILDEPTAALDPIAESNMYAEYRKISEGKSSLFISHRLASTKFCDRILFIDHGSILEEGTHESLIERQGKYAEVFDVQSKYYREGGAEENVSFY